MARSKERDYEDNQSLLMIRPNEWISNNEYKKCTLVKVSNEEYRFLYGTLNEYSAWVQVVKENNNWIYYPLGNKSYRSKSYTWLGDLLDDAIEDMQRAKI